MATNYIPRPGSLAAHACAWFKVNPGRQLTLQQICGRWGGTAHTAAAQLGAAEDAEFLLSERIGRNDVYSAGPMLAGWTPLNDSLAESAWNPAPAQAAAPAPTPAAPSALPAAAPATRATVKGKRLPPLDVTKLQVKTGDLLSPVRGGPHSKGSSLYAPLFDKLQQPNSFVEVPSAYVTTLNKSLARYRKEHPQRVFRLVKASEATHQLQRLADKPGAR